MGGHTLSGTMGCRALVTFCGVVVTLCSTELAAATTLSLPYYKGFEAMADVDSGGFMCPPVENRCALPVNENGTRDEYLIDDNDAFSGQRSVRFGIDNATDSETYRAETTEASHRVF